MRRSLSQVSMPPRPSLVTQRLVLVPLTREAARALVGGENPGLPLGVGYPHRDTLDALRISSDAGEDTGGWFITLRGRDESAGAVGTVIGDLGTKGWVDADGAVEIGYGLASTWWGQGFGTEAVGALVQWLQAHPDVRRITAEVEIGNIASRRLLERLGFALTEVQGASWWLELLAPPDVSP